MARPDGPGAGPAFCTHEGVNAFCSSATATATLDMDPGYDGDVVHLPGHTRGSVGVVPRDHGVFCGDLLANILGGPGLEFFIDDLAAATKSVERLRKMDVGTVYPGHGKAFDLARLNFRAWTTCLYQLADGEQVRHETQSL